jgi:hypothetical protein
MGEQVRPITGTATGQGDFGTIKHLIDDPYKKEALQTRRIFPSESNLLPKRDHTRISLHICRFMELIRIFMLIKRVMPWRLRACLNGDLFGDGREKPVSETSG